MSVLGRPDKFIDNYDVIGNPGRRFEEALGHALQYFLEPELTKKEAALKARGLKLSEKENKERRVNITLDSDMDHYQGTDMIVDNDTHIDATADFADKDHMPLWKETDIPATISRNFKIGIRTGNSYKNYTEFNTPVVVVGIDASPGDYDANCDVIESNISKHIGEILMECQDMKMLFEEYLETKDKEAIADYRVKKRSFTADDVKKSRYQEALLKLHVEQPSANTNDYQF